ncbi:hypothetical protein [Candidatus Poriferisodalis sp.]|uniref:hypothetical protein n=1 Tax=Candidatus Poriferisodalis sp. TaxID=3101277 RepID=UPI003B51ED6F
MSAAVIVGALAIGNACTALFGEAAEGPSSRLVQVEYRPDAWDDARYSPRQVLLDIGSRCITGTGRDGTRYLLLFETGRELVEADGSPAISGVYLPNLSLLRPATNVASVPQAPANLLGGDPETLYFDPYGAVVRGDRTGFWVGAHGEERNVGNFATQGTAVDGEVMLASIRAVGHPGLRWLTTPYPECEQYPHAWVPNNLPT